MIYGGLKGSNEDLQGVKKRNQEKRDLSMGCIADEMVCLESVSSLH